MAAKDNVVIRMSAEDAGAFEAWRKAAKGPEMFEEAVDKAGRKGKQHSDELAGSLEHVAGKWISIHAAMDSVRKLFETLMEAQREFEGREAAASQAADTALRRYFVTAKISGEKEQAASTQRIGAAALRQRSGLPEAGAAANLLTQFGVSREQAEGGALEEVLQMQQAAPAGADPQEFSRRVLDIIRRSTPGGKVNAASIRNVGVTMRQLQSSDLGFNAEAVDLYAKHATLLQQGGYDTATALALSAAISEKYDPRQARSIIKEIAKPGMQKGEAAFLARARGALGRGGAEDYERAVDIGRESIASTIAESQTGATLAEMGEKKLNTEQIRNRLAAEVRASGAPEGLRKAVMSTYEHPFGGFAPAGWLSDEQRSRWALSNLNQTSETLNQMQERIVGRQPLTIRIKSHDGRDVPHSVEAAGIQGR